jgi:predicted Zn-dependent peptidase
MKLVTSKITKKELQELAAKSFGDLIKAVVDVRQEIFVVDAELHADEEAYLLEQGSKQQDLWGINLYPKLEGDDWLEFDSMINLRPNQGNLTRGIDNQTIKDKIKQIINSKVV